MSLSQAQFDEFRGLLGRMTDGQLTGDETARLNGLLADDDAQQVFADYAMLDVCLEMLCRKKVEDGRRTAEEENLPSPFGELAGTSLPSPFGRGAGGEGGVPAVENQQPMFPTPHSVLRTPYSFLPTTPLGNVAFSYAMSAVLVCIGLFIFSLMSASSPSNAVVENHPTNTDFQNPTQPNLPVPELKTVSIARITGMVDCVWVNENEAPFHNKIKQHDKFALKSGLMEITYHTGAKVILQGPCTYEVESADGGFLSLGKLTARVESRSRLPDGTVPTDHDTSKSRPAGGTYFAVRTPTATVTDLGTEFGVEVDKSGMSAAHVFRGSVRMALTTADGKEHGMPMILGNNQSAISEKTEEHGAALRLVDGKSAKITAQFTRAMPSWEPLQIVNPSFEEPVLKEGEWANRFLSIPGWERTGTKIAGPERITAAMRIIHDGKQYAFIDHQNDGVLRQTLSTLVGKYSAYKLTVQTGTRIDEVDPMNGVEAVAELRGAESGRLLASNQSLIIQKGEWQELTVYYVRKPGDPVNDRLQIAIRRINGKFQVLFDDVKVFGIAKSPNP